jgi:hypothetical protein
MNVKVERIIGVTLFFIGLALGVIINLFTSDSSVQNWYNKNRTWILCIAGVSILVGIILIFFSSGKAGKSTKGTKSLKHENHSLTVEDEQFLNDQLNRHQENLRYLNKQKSIYAAGEEPLHLLNQIDAEKKTIKEIEEQLHK